MPCSKMVYMKWFTNLEVKHSGYNMTTKMDKSTTCRISEVNISSYLSEANDSMGVIVDWNDNSHLTTKANLSPALRVLQADPEVLFFLRDVVIYDINCYLQLAITWCKVQLAITVCQKLSKTH